MLRAELKVLEGKHQGKAISLNVKQFLVGREPDCHLRPNSEMVSRHHCVFLVDDYTVRVRDLGSTNGTYVNGERIQGQIVLKPGDRVEIGKLSFELVVKQAAPVPVAVAAPVEVGSVPAPPPAARSQASVLDEEPTRAGSETMEISPPVDADTTVISTQALQQQATAPKRAVISMPDVILPDPETTGAKDVVIGSTGSPVGASGEKAATPSSAAADIIKNRGLRRPPPSGK